MRHANGSKEAIDRFLAWSAGYRQFLALTIIVLLVTDTGASAQLWKQSSQNPFCKKIYNQTQNPSGTMQASSGAQAACFGPQANGSATSLSKLPLSILGASN